MSYEIDGQLHQDYEVAYRTTTKNSERKIDGGEVMPIIKYKGKESELVFIANFRPAVGKFCVEFPAGLLESSDF